MRIAGLGRRAASRKRANVSVGPYWCLGVIISVGLLVGEAGRGVYAQRPSGSGPQLLGVPAPAEPGNDYRYDARGRRDPLEPLVKEKPPDTLTPVQPSSGRPPEPLERFDVSALQLVGIVWGHLGRRAMIKAPDGKSYFVDLETHMGKYGGRVTAIEDDHLVIEELYRNSDEKIVPKTLTIPLRRKDKKEG